MKTKNINKLSVIKEYILKFVKNPIVIFFIALIITISALSRYYIILYNRTESLPNKLFLVKKNTLPQKCGDYIAFKPTSNRYYKNEIFVKIVGGFPNDIITKSHNRNVSINHRLVLKAKEKSLRGDSLEIIKFEGEIPQKYYFVYANHKDSYDSRYEEIGLINERKIIGIAVPIF